ncbi:hypothetical protein VSDG_01964 [Cytospora chrysosperma]|uniref:Uncharacterized protein n=1 Tax=Cytospora chrysosperma TaxID=252740 RepID=A0A423WHX2_CYTCH|nr:hypothetical protein VSDG_01964 [Valsa sordida]
MSQNCNPWALDLDTAVSTIIGFIGILISLANLYFAWKQAQHARGDRQPWRARWPNDALQQAEARRIIGFEPAVLPPPRAP